MSHTHRLRTGQLCGHRHRLVRVRFAVGSGSSGSAPRPERRPLKCTRWFVSGVRAVTAWDLRTVSSPRRETPRPLATTLHPWRPLVPFCLSRPARSAHACTWNQLCGLCVWSVTTCDVLRFGYTGAGVGPRAQWLDRAALQGGTPRRASARLATDVCAASTCGCGGQCHSDRAWTRVCVDLRLVWLRCTPGTLLAFRGN